MLASFIKVTRAACLASVLATPVLAHHSAAMFDQNKELILTGTVREVQWMNPHIWIQLLVTDDTGKQVEWSLEGGSPRVSMRVGLKRTSLKPGDKITVAIHPLRSGGLSGELLRGTLPNGQSFGSPPEKPHDYKDLPADQVARP